MRTLLVGLGVMAVAGSLVAQAQPQSKGGEDETGPYEVVEGWPKPWAASGYVWGSQPGVFAESADRIFILARGELELPESFRAASTASGARSGSAPPTPPPKCGTVSSSSIDIWPNLRQLNDIFVGADDRVWVVDGTNARLLQFDRDGHLLYWWGTYGTQPGQFWEPHQVSVDADGNLYVADSFGGRTQKYRPRPGADRSQLLLK